MNEPNPFSPPKSELTDPPPTERPSAWKRAKWTILPNAIIVSAVLPWAIFRRVVTLPEIVAGLALAALFLYYPWRQLMRLDVDSPLWWSVIYTGTLPFFLVAMVLEIDELDVPLLVNYVCVSIGLAVIFWRVERLRGVEIYTRLFGYIYWPAGGGRNADP